MLPIGAALGVLGGLVLVWLDGDPSSPLVSQLATGTATGGFLGAMAGIVLGLGHWEHFVDFPARDLDGHSMLVVVDVAAQGREEEAKKALRAAGAASVEVCTSEAAQALVRDAARTSNPSP